VRRGEKRLPVQENIKWQSQIIWKFGNAFVINCNEARREDWTQACTYYVTLLYSIKL
jgi:hypothetical protein